MELNFLILPDRRTDYVHSVERLIKAMYCWRAVQVKYPVDPAHMMPGESRLFTKYLATQSLHVDVWDGDSLLLIGSCIVELKV